MRITKYKNQDWNTTGTNNQNCCYNQQLSEWKTKRCHQCRTEKGERNTNKETISCKEICKIWSCKNGLL